MYSREELEKFHGKQVKLLSNFNNRTYIGYLDVYYGSDVKVYDIIETDNPRYCPGEYLFISIDNIELIESINDPATLYGRYIPHV